MSTVTPLSAWNKGTNVLIFSRGLPVAAIFNFAAAGGWGRFAAEALAPVSHVLFQMLSEVSGNVGASKGSLHWSSTSGKRDGGSTRQSSGSRREVSCWFSICLQMFSVECGVAADHCFHQVWIGADSPAHSPMCSEQGPFQQVLSLQDCSVLEEKVVWLFGHEEQLGLFPALTPVSKLASQLWAEAQAAEHAGAAVTCTWLGVGIQAGQLWCPPLAQVAGHGKHSCVSVNIIYWHVTSPDLVQASKCLLCLCASIAVIYCERS